MDAMIQTAFFDHLYQVFTANEAELNRLDAMLGDGDHGSTMLRGLRVATQNRQTQTLQAEPQSSGQARLFMRAAGGAGGTLFGLLLLEIESWLVVGQESLHQHLARAAERIQDLGEVKLGDKTMIDALVPAVVALADADARHDAALAGSLQAAVVAAAQGRDSTQPLAAQGGRARYVEGKGIGHLDPGACSVHLILTCLKEVAVGTKKEAPRP